MSFASATSFASDSFAVISSSVLFFKTTIVFDVLQCSKNMPASRGR
jgi:hypothetical protein